jgi:hypothetical protein
MRFTCNMLSPIQENIRRTHFVIKQLNKLIDIILIMLENKRREPQKIFHFLRAFQLVKYVHNRLINVIRLQVLDNICDC